jgi:hypothetical protein
VGARPPRGIGGPVIPAVVPVSITLTTGSVIRRKIVEKIPLRSLVQFTVHITPVINSFGLRTFLTNTDRGPCGDQW